MLPLQGISKQPVPDRYWVSNLTARQYVQNNVYETIAGTQIIFLAQKSIYEVSFSASFRFDRSGFWQTALSKILTTMGTLTPANWTMEYNEVARLPVLTRITRNMLFILEVNPGDLVTLDAQTHNGGTNNYITYVQTLVSVK